MADIIKTLVNPPEVPENQVTPPHASVEIFSKITEQIFSKDNIRVKTDLNDKQILAFSRADYFSKRFNIPIIGALVQNINEYSISRGRKGRKEYESIAKASFSSFQNEEAETKHSIPGRLMGLN